VARTWLGRLGGGRRTILPRGLKDGLEAGGLAPQRFNSPLAQAEIAYHEMERDTYEHVDLVIEHGARPKLSIVTPPKPSTYSAVRAAEVIVFGPWEILFGSAHDMHDCRFRTRTPLWHGTNRPGPIKLPGYSAAAFDAASASSD